MTPREFYDIPPSGIYKLKFESAGDIEFFHGQILWDDSSVVMRGEWFSWEFTPTTSWSSFVSVDHIGLEFIEFLDMETGWM